MAEFYYKSLKIVVTRLTKGYEWKILSLQGNALHGGFSLAYQNEEEALAEAKQRANDLRHAISTGIKPNVPRICDSPKDGDSVSPSKHVVRKPEKVTQFF